jgi:soluble lytic murein transglycosylase-like protein
MSRLSDVLKTIADFAADISIYITDAVGEVAHLISSLAALASLDFRKAGAEAKLALGAAPQRVADKRKRDAGGSSMSDLLPNFQGAEEQRIYRDVIVQEAQRIGIDPRIALAVAMQESGIRQTNAKGLITSSTGALGIMQLEPDTATPFRTYAGAWLTCVSYTTATAGTGRAPSKPITAGWGTSTQRSQDGGI